jgi:hypothetical protein
MDYPSNLNDKGTVKDPFYLYESLGSFWTRMFQEKETIKGYTLGSSEEIIQRYYDLVESINSYSATNINVFHKEKWLPIKIYKSKFNTAPFVFEKTGAIFGAQNVDNKYFSSEVFQLGLPKTPIAEVYLYNVDTDFNNFGIIADKIINPSVIFTYGSDVILNNNVLYFNTNIFNNDKIAKAKVINENGLKQTYIDKNGVEQDEEFIILWAYNALVDKSHLYNFNNDQFFKDILSSIVKLHIDGATICGILQFCAAILGVPVVNDTETIESIFNDSSYTYVVTDKNVYKYDIFYTLLPGITVGAVVNKYDILVNAIQYFDSNHVQFNWQSEWWKQDMIVGNKLAMSQFLFNGDYVHQLMFSNNIELATLDALGNINFPIIGNAKDIKTFNDYLNLPANKEIIKEKLNLTNPGDIYPLIPLQFVIDNFMRNNIAMLSFTFKSDEIQSKFLALLPILKNLLPPYIYLIFKISMSLVDELYNLEDNINEEEPDISRGLRAQAYNYVIASGVSLTTIDSTAVSEHRVLTAKLGGVLHPIPAGATSQTYANLLLLDFS